MRELSSSLHGCAHCTVPRSAQNWPLYRRSTWACDNVPTALASGEHGEVKLPNGQAVPLCYKGTLFHRIVPQFVVQVGRFSRTSLFAMPWQYQVRTRQNQARANQ